jgi:hypothetical protein
MRTTAKVLALDFKTGTSVKEGPNKGKSYVSYKVLDLDDGNFFDMFSWADMDKKPVTLSVPCLIECTFKVGKKFDEFSVDLVEVHKMSAQFDLEAIFGKIPLSPVGGSFDGTSIKQTKETQAAK